MTPRHGVLALVRTALDAALLAAVAFPAAMIAKHGGLLPLNRSEERGPLWLEPIALKANDVVQGDDAPEMAEGGAGGAIFVDVVEQFVEGLLAQQMLHGE